ncbi:MAG: hypothetical protein EAX81_05290 [Candidatus Thorarchaeota archaeon]|nr:hypothetical protein [Candidatus Thorarchaeota archaeon]
MTRFLDEEIRKSILAEIRPTEEEIKKQKKQVSRITESLKKFAHSEWKYTRIQAEGSTGKKQTQLRGASDLDIFVILNPEDYGDVLAKNPRARMNAVNSIMEAVVDEWFIPALRKLKPSSCQKTYSQHPYLSVKLNGFDVDIVGCFEVSPQELLASGPISAMDRTIHHSEYVNLHLCQETRDDVRILKSFARASYAYADTCAVGRMGFTGYALELLIIRGGGLEQALKYIIDLERTPLDPEGRSLAKLKEDPSFRDDFVFIIDPIDPNRNVSSSFDERTVRLLRMRAEKLLEEFEEGNINRIMKMVIEKPISLSPLPSWIVRHSIVFEFKEEKSYHYSVFRDKLYSLGKLVAGQLQHEQTGEIRFGATLFEVYFEAESYSLAFLVENMMISNVYSYKGPPLNLSTAVEDFRRVHADTVEKAGYIWTTKEREFTSARSLAETLIDHYGIKGLSRKEPGETSTKLLRVILDHVLPVEHGFPVDSIRNKPK